RADAVDRSLARHVPASEPGGPGGVAGGAAAAPRRGRRRGSPHAAPAAPGRGDDHVRLQLGRPSRRGIPAVNPAALATSADLGPIPPELLLTVAGTVILLLDAFAPSLRRAWTLLALLSTGAAAWLAWTLPAGASFHGLIEATPVTGFLSVVVLLAAALSLL